MEIALLLIVGYLVVWGYRNLSRAKKRVESFGSIRQYLEGMFRYLESVFIHVRVVHESPGMIKMECYKHHGGDYGARIDIGVIMMKDEISIAVYYKEMRTGEKKVSRIYTTYNANEVEEKVRGVLEELLK